MYFYKEMVAAYYDCDVNNKLKLSGALRYMQQTSSEQLSSLDQSPEKLHGEGMVFLLTKSNLKINRMPECSEVLSVGTAAVAVKGPRFFREFVIDTREGERLVSGWSLWVLTDTVNHRILRPSAYPYQFPWQDPQLEQEVGDLPIPKAFSQGAALRRMELPVRYSHLDVNHHVNNSMYADFVCDALPYEALIAGEVKTLALNFGSEAKHGEVLDIQCGALSHNTYKVAGCHGGKPCFDAFVELG